MSLPYASPRWPAATATLGLWALAAASVVFWGLRLAAPVDGLAPPAVALAPAAAIDTAAVGRFLGVRPATEAVVATPGAATRFALLGVIAGGPQGGAALIAFDGKPARPFRIGMTVGEGYVLQAVGTRSAALGTSRDAAAAFTLQMPVPPMAVMAPPPLR